MLAIPMANIIFANRERKAGRSVFAFGKRDASGRYIFNTKEKPFATRVHELKMLYGGMKGLLEISGLGRSSISMWKINGIPEHQLYRFLTIGLRKNLNMPKWLIDPEYQEPFT